jgi:hypothetical protein
MRFYFNKTKHVYIFGISINANRPSIIFDLGIYSLAIVFGKEKVNE